MVSSSDVTGLTHGDRVAARYALFGGETGGKVNDEKDSARRGGSVGRHTGTGASMPTPIVRAREANEGDVGEPCGERRRAKEEIGQDAAGGTMLSCSERRLGGRAFGREVCSIGMSVLHEERRGAVDFCVCSCR